MKRIYMVAYHQSKFGKLMGTSIPEILRRTVQKVVRRSKCPCNRETTTSGAGNWHAAAYLMNLCMPCPRNGAVPYL